MGKLGKIFLYLIACVIGIVAIAAVALMFFFDPNDFRDDIAAQVQDATGRELLIEGDLSISVFPWLAVEVGRTELGNAEGFGDDPWLSFDSARLSVRLLPLLFSRKIAVGTASLDGFEANLAVAADGVTNWDDLAGSSDDTAPEVPETDAGSSDVALDIANVTLSDAVINYSDAQSGSSYTVTGLNVATGRIAAGESFDIEGAFEFAAAPGDLGGSLSIGAGVTLGENLRQITVEGLNVSGSLHGIVSEPTDFNFDSRSISVDTESQRMTVGEIDLSVLGLAMSADVQPFSYAGSADLQAALRVAEFSLKELLAILGNEPPVTADPNAFGKLSFEANATLGQESLSLQSMTLVMDDTTMTGELAVPLTEAGSLVFDLRADSINLDNYMAPAVESAGASDDEQSDVEIPVELIRALKANGTVRMDEAFLGPIKFTSMALGVDGSGKRLRLHPISAQFFDGAYNGDVRIDASASVPSLSVNERISDVNLAAMARAMYGIEDITGTINGSFELSGSGATLSAISSDVDGTLSFELMDGAWEGNDVWHQLRSARAIYKREAPPEPSLPLRTEFSAITATGTVTDGVFTNKDLLAEMPFLRITGAGTINLGTREIDYSVQARVLEKPEFVSDASDEELADFTEALIPIRIRGSLGSPSFRPDVEGMFRAEVERAIEEKTDELKNDLLNRLLGGDQQSEAEDGAGDGADAEEEDEEEKDIEDELKDRLKDLFPR